MMHANLHCLTVLPGKKKIGRKGSGGEGGERKKGKGTDQKLEKYLTTSIFFFSTWPPCSPFYFKIPSLYTGQNFRHG